jgi:predicted lipoprotein
MFKKVLIVTILVASVFACSTNEDDVPTIADNFDRNAMLINIADNIIIPAYDDFSNKMETLKVEGELFIATPNQTNLDALRASWLVAYKTWQHIEVFNIGKAEELQYSFYMNVFPLTVADVEGNISSGSYDLNSANNHDAQGFPALDYLLYGVATTDAEILAIYTSNSKKDNYKKYLSDVLNQMDSLTIDMVTNFKANRNTFVTSTQNNATSIFNKLINDYIFYYEKGLRANKFGIPAGVFSSTPLPIKVEALYKNDISKELALESLTAVKNLFEGKHYASSTVGIGFKAYLIKLDRLDISTKINSQFASATTQIQKLDDNFTNQINTNNTAMLTSYDELQKVVVLLKVDMLQAFNINVDYVDADGD